MRHTIRTLAITAGTILILGGVPAGVATSGAAGTPTCFGKKPTIMAKAGQVTNGTNHADVIIGSSGDDQIAGRGGKDRICGKGGDDILAGNGGNDKLNGQKDSGFGDTLLGVGGDDLLKGGGKPSNSGSDVADIALYITANKGVKASLATGIATGEGQDKLVHIEDLVGSDFADRLTGNAGQNFFFGGEGNDNLDVRGGSFQVIFPGNGNDKVKGPSGQQTAISYEEVDGPVTIDLSAGTVTGGAGSDTLTNITDAFGSPGDDTITGTSAGEQLGGYSGNDTINTGGNSATFDDPYTFLANFDFDIVFGDDGAFGIGDPGDDTITGGAGLNISCYCGAISGVTVDLQAGTATGGGGNDTLSSIQGLIGSRFADTLQGTAANEIFEVSAGADSLDGRGGEDTLEAFDSTGLTADLAAGTASAQVPAFVNGRNVLRSMTATVAGIEDLWASLDDADTLGGDNAANRFYSFGGNDSLTGQQGDDYLDGGGGTDSADGGNGTDTCIDVESPTACESSTAAVMSRGVMGSSFRFYRARTVWSRHF